MTLFNRNSIICAFLLLAGLSLKNASAKRSSLCSIQTERGLKALHKRVAFSQDVLQHFNQEKSLELINKSIQEMDLDEHLSQLKELGDENAPNMYLTKMYQNLALHIEQEIAKLNSHAHTISIRGIDSETNKTLSMNIQNQDNFLHLGHVSELNVYWPKFQMSLIIRMKNENSGITPELVQLELKEQSLVSVIGVGLAKKCQKRVESAEYKQPELVSGNFNILSNSHHYSLFDPFPGHAELISIKNSDRCEILKIAQNDKIKLINRELATADLKSPELALNHFDSQFFASKFSDEVKKLNKEFQAEFSYPETAENGFYLEGSILKGGQKVRMDSEQWSLILTNVVTKFVNKVRTQKKLGGLKGLVEIKTDNNTKVVNLQTLITENLFHDHPRSIKLVMALEKGDSLEVKFFQKSQGRGIAMESQTDSIDLQKLFLRTELKNSQKLEEDCLNSK